MYKRQAVAVPQAIRVPVVRVPTVIVGSVTSVSYTHLDVYKRQALYSIWSRLLSTLLVIIVETTNFAHSEATLTIEIGRAHV